MLDNWNCPICKIYNDILTNNCISCQSDKPDWLTSRYQLVVEIKRGIYFERIPLRLEREVTPQEELFAKFYNQEKVLIKDMDIAQLRTHREELATIAFEAKARVGAIDDDLRGRNKDRKNKEFILTETHQPESDAINEPALRAKRMTKIDKMRADLSKYLDKETVDKMIKDMEKTVTDKEIKSITFKELAKTPLETRIDDAKENGTITDTKPVAEATPVKANPFLKFKKA